VIGLLRQGLGLASNISDAAVGRGQVGGVIIVLLVGVVSAWLYIQRPDPLLTSSSSSSAMRVDLSEPEGFRRDVWFLPDEELLGFVEVPAGPFLMGSDPNHDQMLFDNERWVPSGGRELVHLPTYYIGRYEVTVAQFSMFVEATGFRVDDGALARPANHPVTHISWPDALAYCRWLESSLLGSPATPNFLRELIENGWRVSLPTEAEWEKAARGSDGRIFPWGDTPRRDRANYEATDSAPVGSFNCPECPFGLFDMSGNVWELTSSAYRPYPYGPITDLATLPQDALWVMRGGSYSDSSRNIRAAVRGGADPGARRSFIGFRVALIQGVP
jgi:formylglycine-generating enzyme required for sulfatase activity